MLSMFCLFLLSAPRSIQQTPCCAVKTLAAIAAAVAAVAAAAAAAAAVFVWVHVAAAASSTVLSSVCTCLK